MPIVTPWYVVNKAGGLDDIFDATVKRVVDDFEPYSGDAALQAVWSATLGAATPTLEITDPVYGAKSLKVVVSAAAVVGANLYDASAAYTDYTTEANEGTANDVVLLPAAGDLQINDAFYVGAYYPFKKCTFNIGTAGVGAWAGSWEYWNGTAWTAVTVTDGTSGFKVAGSNDVVITNMPLDWEMTNNAGLLSTTCFWLRYRLTTGDAAPTTRPLGTQIWIKYGAVSRDFANEMWGYFFPGNLRFMKFRATAVTQTSDVLCIQRDASARYTLFRGYQFVIGNEPAREMLCELDSDSDLDCEGTTAWNQAIVDEIAWVFLDTGTFRLDQVEVYDDVAIMDRIGIGTEPASLDGVEGTVHSKLRTVFTKLDEILGETEQYVKFGPSLCELNFAYTWGLEIKAEGAAPVADYTIVPGVVDVKRLRLGTETDILTDQACSETDGRIYYQYTPTETDFALGDEIILRFHDGETYEPVGMTWTLAANVAAPDTTLTFTTPQAFQFEIGDLLWLRDNAAPAGQIVTVLTVDSPTQITLSAAVAAAYTTAQSVRVTKTIHTTLQPAYCYASISRLPDINADVKYGILSDWDTFDIADVAPVLTSKWVGEVYSGVAGSSTAAMTGGAAVVTADPGIGALSTGYWLRHAPVINSKSFNVIVDLSSIAWGTADATGAKVGLYITPGVAYDATNYVLISRQKTDAVNNISVIAAFVGGSGYNQTVAITEDTLAFRIERRGNIWRLYYSSTTYPSYNWVLASAFLADDTLCSMGPNVSACLFAYSGGGAAANTVAGSFDNFQYYINDRSYENWIAGVTAFMEGGAQRSLADMPFISAQVDCNTSPQVDQDSMQVARIAIENARHDTDLILTTEYASTALTIERYRQGLDTDWTSVVASAAMTEADGYAYYSYTFPAASWQDGDLIRYRIAGCVISIADQTFNVPEMTVHGVVGGISAIMKKLNLLQEVLFMSDFDTFDVAYAASVDNERWLGSNYSGGAELSTANINTTTSGKAYVLADPDGTPAATGYGLIHKPAHNGRHFDIIVDADYTWGTEGAGYLMGGLMVFKGSPTYDSQNYLYIVRQKSTTAATNNIIVDGKLNNVAIASATAAITDDAVALRIERNENMFRLYYSLTKSPNYQWNLVKQVDDGSDYMGRCVTDMLFAYSPGAADAESLQVDFDNYKGYTNFGILEKLGYIIVAEGELTASSATVPADTSLGGKATGSFNGCMLMPIEGALCGQARTIVSFTTGTGVFTLDPERPFTAVPGTVRYVILADQQPGVPATDGLNNTMPAHVLGSKADTADWTYDATQSSVVRLLKGLLGAEVIEEGTLTTDSATLPADTGLGAYASDYFKGAILMTVEGAVKFQPRLIVGFTTGTGVFKLDPEQPFTGVPGASKYVILSWTSQLVPAVNSTNNDTPAHVTGNKTDAPDFTWDATTSSLVALLKGVLGAVVIEEGTLTADSATVPADTVIGAAYGNDYFNGSLLMTIEGAAKFQPRLIVDFATGTGIYTLDPDHPFTVAPGASKYVILGVQGPLVAAADSTYNYTEPHVAGNKADNPRYILDTNRSLMGYLKAALHAEVIATGTFTTDSATVPADTGRVEANDYWNGCWLMPLSGTVAFQPRLIVDFGATVMTLDPDHPFTAAPGAVAYAILSPMEQLVAAANGTNNYTPAHVTGNKTDIPVPKVAATASLIGYAKAVAARGMVAVQGICTTGASQTIVASTDLVGYGDGFFNDNYYMQILRDAGGAGAAPEHEVRKITAYTSTTGSFTCDAFSANVDAGDQLLILHESLVAIGRDDANNTFDSSSVVSDDDGSLLERAEYIQQQLGYGVRLLTETGGGSTTLITAAEITEAAGWWKNALLLGISGANIGVCRPVVSNTVGTLTVYPALRAANVIADTYLLISAYKPQITEQQPDTPVNLSLTQGAVATTVFDLSVAGYSYRVNDLWLKSADPTNGGATTQYVTITLYVLINDVSTAVDTFTIDGTNFGTYFSLFDMFGQHELTGDNIKVTAALSAGVTTPIAVTGQYQHSLVYTGAG